MRTIYITDRQIDMIKRSLNEGAFNKVVENKVPSAQDQVKGKVNAGIMDGVTGCGMMEDEMLCETPTIEGATKDADSFKDAFKPIADFMKSEGLNVYPFPSIELKWDEQDGLFIKTGYYLPSEKKIVLFCKDRHPKDILRSYAHEMIHHMQNLNGDDLNFTSEDDVKDNDKLEKLESEAYLKGNIYFRKWTEYERSNKNSLLNENILIQKRLKQINKIIYELF